MTYYIICASNESIPGILYISYFHPSQGTLKKALDFLNRKPTLWSKCRYMSEGRRIPYQKYRQLPTPYIFVFIKKWGEWRGELGGSFDSDIWENIMREFKLSKLNIVDNSLR